MVIKYNVLKSDVDYVKKLIENDLKDSLCLGMSIKKWLKQIKKIVNQYKYLEPFKDYFYNYAHVLALQEKPEDYSKL